MGRHIIYVLSFCVETVVDNLQSDDKSGSSLGGRDEVLLG